MDNHIYCCNRCGTIFESETDEDYCESCRALFRRSRPRTAVYLHECGVCGRKYRSKSKTPARPLCPDCKAAEQRMSAERLSPSPKKPAPAPKLTIADIDSLARERGISYGRAVALMEDGKL